MPKRLVVLVAHPEDEQRYENGWTPSGDELEYITTNPKILAQCVNSLDAGDQWVYVQRMQHGNSPSRIIGRAKVAGINEAAMRVQFEGWEPYDAPSLKSFGGSAIGDFPE